MSSINPFHLAIPVHDLTTARMFYTRVLKCSEGRSDEHWVDMNFFGHQLVLHYKEGMKPDLQSNSVDDHDVPIPHFGVVLEWEQWHSLAAHLKKCEVSFIIEPYIRFKGSSGEQATLFFLDPSGNALEFKSFQNPENLFAK